MIVLGLVLFVLGLLVKISILWTIGIIVLVVCAVLLSGRLDGPLGRRPTAVLLIHGVWTTASAVVGVSGTSRTQVTAHSRVLR